MKTRITITIDAEIADSDSDRLTKHLLDSVRDWIDVEELTNDREEGELPAVHVAFRVSE